MRNALLAVLLAALLPLTAHAAPDRFQQRAAAFLDEYLALFPETATALGDHRFDNRLADWSAAGRERMRVFYVKWLKETDALGQLPLSEENAVDLALWRTNLESGLFGLQELKDWQRNPLRYNPGDALYPLMARDFAPLEKRMESLRGRLERIPRWLEVAQANLDNPPRLHTETAIQQNAGTISLIGPELDAILATAPPLVVARLQPARERATQALREYGEWLEEDLLPRSEGEFRLGRELWERKLAYTLESDLTPSEILARAQEELERTQVEMASVARPLFEREFPGQPVPAERRELIRAVLDRLAEDHPDNRTILDKARRGAAWSGRPPSCGSASWSRCRTSPST